MHQHRSNAIRSLIAALTLALLGGLSHANDTIVTHYVLPELSNQPGTIQLSPNFLTLIEFPDLVQTVATGRADLIQVEVDDNRILLRPARSTGRTDLIVRVSGTNAMFRIDIDPDNGTPRRYVIHATPPTPTHHPDAPDTVPSTAIPTTSSSHGGMPIGDNAPQLPYEFTYSTRVNENGQLTIYYSLTNRSPNPIANDGSRLRVMDELGTVPYATVRMNADGTPNRLQPGYTEHGVLTLERSVLGIPRIEWPVVEQGPGRTYVINEVVVNIAHE